MKPAATTRYSLKALAEHEWTPSVARELVENVSHRLDLQTRACAALLDGLNSKPRLSSPFHHNAASKNVRHLLHVHRDTLQNCRHVALHPQLFARWSVADRHAVAALAEEVRSRHAPGIERWVEHSNFVRSQQQPDYEDKNDNTADDEALQAILQRRWSVQLLCDQLVKLPKGRNAAVVGCDVGAVVVEAYTEASALCDAHWQLTPDLDLKVLDTTDEGVRATVVRPWLHHSLVELFKNAMHSTLQHWSRPHEGRASRSPLPITVRISADSAGDLPSDRFVTIEVLDRGVGLQREGKLTPSVTGVPWAFQIGASSSSSTEKWDRLNVQQSYAPVRSPLNSLGMGLPVARMMMRHFGGDVTLLVPQQRDDEGGIGGGGPGCVAGIVLPLDATILEPEVCVVE